jgi:hypothetical protein
MTFVATEFERDEMIDLEGAAELRVSEAVLGERLPMDFGRDSPTLLRRAPAHDGHVRRHDGPRGALRIGKRTVDGAGILLRAWWWGVGSGRRTRLSEGHGRGWAGRRARRRSRRGCLGARRRGSGCASSEQNRKRSRHTNEDLEHAATIHRLSNLSSSPPALSERREVSSRQRPRA